jgi:hypothetical protein
MEIGDRILQTPIPIAPSYFNVSLFREAYFK